MLFNGCIATNHDAIIEGDDRNSTNNVYNNSNIDVGEAWDNGAAFSIKRLPPAY